MPTLTVTKLSTNGKFDGGIDSLGELVEDSKDHDNKENQVAHNIAGGGGQDFVHARHCLRQDASVGLESTFYFIQKGLVLMH